MIVQTLRRIRRSVNPSWQDYFASALSELQGKAILHVGCGADRIGGATRLDMNTRVSPDIIWDLNKKPYPIEDGTFDAVIAVSVMEHLDDVLSFLDELHRVLKPGGRCLILCPHFSSASANTDPTHKQRLGARSLDYVCVGTDLEKTYGFYVDFRFDKRIAMVHLQGIWGKFPLLQSAISRRPAFWEDHLCYLVRGAGVFWDLRAIK